MTAAGLLSGQPCVAAELSLARPWGWGGTELHGRTFWGQKGREETIPTDASGERGFHGNASILSLPGVDATGRALTWQPHSGGEGGRPVGAHSWGDRDGHTHPPSSMWDRRDGLLQGWQYSGQTVGNILFLRNVHDSKA